MHVLADRGPGLLSVTSLEGHLGYSPLTSLIPQWEVREPAPTTPLPREKGESMFQAERKWSSLSVSALGWHLLVSSLCLSRFVLFGHSPGDGGQIWSHCCLLHGLCVHG